MEHEIYVSREVKNLGHNNSAALIKKAVNMALDAEGVDVPCIVSVMLTDDEGIHRVNNEFRGVDRATDVLSFPRSRSRYASGTSSSAPWTCSAPRQG